ncbi:UBX domain-containing protein 4-like [Phymastichus coffea]|uniref:UBX domain-containing protein 4-like n=1 Tax=Phymastichus coffea TaxID=108790 RepID=UPI00273B7351|nr:UBX domain-containing protein 4-like [Phymastichus coffea]
MKWFQGSIPEAIAASKSKKAIFVVFVEGKDEVSQEVAKTLDSVEVSSRLEEDKFVVIKLQSDSENYTFFAQIYQLVPVPSIFFIGENGAPLEIIGNKLSSNDLASKIDSIVLKAKPQTIDPSASLINSEQSTQSSTSTQGASIVINNSADSTSFNQAEKLKRARELIELQNKKKAEEEEQKEREREIERRKVGRDVQKLRQQQQENEIKEAYSEIMKEKAAEAAAREKILKQIEEDKLERKKRFEMHQQETVAQQQKVQEEAQVRAQAKAQAPTCDMSKARIQFKLPTGESATQTFQATDTLGNLRAYVIQNVQIPFKHFSMSAFFPRRDFSSNDDRKTLTELELVPSSVILILPIKSSNPSSVIKSTDGGGIFSQFLWTLLAPVVSIYNYVMGYLTGRPRGDESNDSNNANRNQGIPPSNNAFPAFGRLGNIGARRLGGQGTSKIRARGNIHTLHSGDDDNDENNTWNGNSTQQM